MSEALTREEILGLCYQRKPKVEPVPGGKFYVCVMDGITLDSWQDGNYAVNRETGELEPQPNPRGRLAARCLCDPAGKRLFRDAEADALGRMDGPLLDEICKVARRLNCLDRESSEKKSKPSPTPEATSDSSAGTPANGA